MIVQTLATEIVLRETVDCVSHVILDCFGRVQYWVQEPLEGSSKCNLYHEEVFSLSMWELTINEMRDYLDSLRTWEAGHKPGIPLKGENSMSDRQLREERIRVWKAQAAVRKALEALNDLHNNTETSMHEHNIMTAGEGLRYAEKNLGIIDVRLYKAENRTPSDIDEEEYI